MNNIKRFLYIAGIGIPLIFNTIGCSSLNKNQQSKNLENSLEVPESVKNFKELSGEYPLGDKPVYVRLSKDVDTYLITSKNGSDLNVFAGKFNLKLKNLEKIYKDYEVGFDNKYNKKLNKIIKDLDKDKNKVITVDELNSF